MSDINLDGGSIRSMSDARFPTDGVNFRTLKRFASILSANTVSAVVSGITAGANILITGTTSAITISVNPNISTSSINANTLFSAGTNLYDIFLTTNDGNDITRVQNGLNTYTGGTGNLPTVNVSALTIDHLTVSGNSVFNSISATTYIGLPIDVYVTGGTYSAGTATFKNSTGGTFNVTGFSINNATQFTGGTVTGETIFTQGVTANTFSATTYYGDGSNLTGIVSTWDGLQVITVGENVVKGNLLFLSSDTKYYKASNLSASTCDTELRIAISAITANNTGSGLVQGQFTTTGLTPGAQYWVGALGDFTTIQPNINYSIVRYIGTSISSTSFEFNPDPTYIELGSSSSDIDNFLPLSGGTVTGQTIFTNGLVANTFSSTTISATTFYGDGSQLTGIISGAIFTGGTVSGNTNFTAGLTANTIFATSITATTFYGDGSHLSGISTANYYTTGATLNGTTAFFNRTDLSSAYTLDLSSISGSSSSNIWSASTGLNSIIANNGSGNLASGNFSVVAGSGNSIYSSLSFIGNGFLNTITGNTSFIGNGSGNTANGIYSTVVNGINNQSLGSSSTILGGNNNYTYPNTNFAIILGGSGNTIYNMPGMGFGPPPNPCGGAFFPPCSFSVPHHTFNLIGNGDKNSIKDQTTYCSILNGTLNEVSTGNTFSFILDGNNNIVNTGSSYSFIVNGSSNYTEANYASVFNGSGNSVFTSGGTIINGFKNALLVNANNSVILGISNFTGTSANTLYTSNANLANGGGVIFSAGTDLYNIFLKIGAVASFTGGTVTGNTNFTAGLTANTISATTISATTYFSGSTNLYDIIHSNVTATTSSLTSVAVQNGLNTYTGGTASLPTINVSALTIDNISVTGNSTFNTLSATSISATTFYGNGMNLTGMPVFTGGTINQLTITGATNFTAGLTANTISATTISATTFFGITNFFGTGADGGGSVLLTGVTSFKTIHDSGTINYWDLVLSPSGSCKFDIWKTASGTTFPTASNTIITSGPPQINGGFYSGGTISTWSGNSLSVGDLIAFNISSVTGATKATLTLAYLKN